MIPESIGSLGNHLWQSTVLAGIVALVTLGLRKNAASVRHCLWLIASVKFLVPISPLIALGRQLEWRRVPEMVHPRWVHVMDGICQPFTSVTPSLSRTEPLSTSVNSVLPILMIVWLCGAAVVVFVWLREWYRLRSALK